MVIDAAEAAARAEAAAAEQLRTFGRSAGLRHALVSVEWVHEDSYVLVGATSRRVRGTAVDVVWTVRCENAAQLSDGFDSPDVAGRALAQEICEPQGTWADDDSGDIRYVGRAGKVFTVLARDHGFDARRRARILHLSDEPWPTPIAPDPARAAARIAAIAAGDVTVAYDGSYTPRLNSRPSALGGTAVAARSDETE